MGIKFLTALFLSQQENYKSHLVVVGEVMKGARKSKANELVGHWRLKEWGKVVAKQPEYCMWGENGD